MAPKKITRKNDDETVHEEVGKKVLPMDDTTAHVLRPVTIMGRNKHDSAVEKLHGLTEDHRYQLLRQEAFLKWLWYPLITGAVSFALLLLWNTFVVPQLGAPKLPGVPPGLSQPVADKNP